MSLTLITGNTLVDNTTAGVAASAVASPLWLPWLQSASEVAGVIAPILGVVWLVIQITAKVREMTKKDPE